MARTLDNGIDVPADAAIDEFIEMMASSDPEVWNYSDSPAPHTIGGSSLSLSLNAHFNQDALKTFIKRSPYRELAAYQGQYERLPLDFPNQEAAFKHLEKLMKTFFNKMTLKTGRNHNNRTSLTIEEAILVMSQSRIAMVVYESDTGACTLYIYDYDTRMYTTNDNVFKKYLAVLRGVVTTQDLRTFMDTLAVKDRSRRAIYQELPPYKIAVRNGVYNTLTGTLEPAKPYLFYTSRIDTDYVENPVHPELLSGKTYEELVSDLAVGNADRIQLIHQMVACVLTGFNPFSAIFCLVGDGGDGKSLFMKLVSEVVGSANIKSMSFPDFADKDAIYSAGDKRLILGSDNPPRINIARALHALKSMSSREPFGVTPKYLSSVDIIFRGTIVQVMNSLPNFGESGESMKRRLVVISCEASHTVHGTEMEILEDDIRHPGLHEYILSGYLNQRFIPFFSALNRVDDHLLEQHLSNTNTVHAFFEYLIDNKVFDGVKAVPKIMLPALYSGFMADHYSDQNPKVASSLYSEASVVLKSLGFVPHVGKRGSRSSVQLSLIEKRFGDDFRVNASVVSDSFEDALDEVKDTRGEFFVLDPGLSVTREPRESRSVDMTVSHYGFFGVLDELKSDMERHFAVYEPIIVLDKPEGAVDISELQTADDGLLVRASGPSDEAGVSAAEEFVPLALSDVTAHGIVDGVVDRAIEAVEALPDDVDRDVRLIELADTVAEYCARTLNNVFLYEKFSPKLLESSDPYRQIRYALDEVKEFVGSRLDFLE